MIFLAAADITAKVAPLVPKFLPALNAPGHRWFPLAMGLALALLVWVIFVYDPGSASHDTDHGSD